MDRHRLPSQPLSQPDLMGEALVAWSSRLVFSLLRAAVRVAALLDLPLARVEQLTRLAYFAELRRQHPRDLTGVAKKLDISLRTAGTLNRSLRTDFFRPENAVAPLRAVTGALVRGPLSLPELAELTGLDATTLSRTLRLLSAHGWVAEQPSAVSLTTGLRSYLDPNDDRRIDALNHQLDVIAASVQARLMRAEEAHAGARSWTFYANPDDLARFMDHSFDQLRQGAISLEHSALAEADGQRVAITIAFAPMEDL